MLSYRKYFLLLSCWDLTCNLRSPFQPNALSTVSRSHNSLTPINICSISRNKWKITKFMYTCFIICFSLSTRNCRECPRDVMVKVMDCGIVVSEFVLQSCYHVHFQTNTQCKGMNHLIIFIIFTQPLRSSRI